MVRYSVIGSPLGAMLVAAKQDALLGVWFEGQKYYPDLSAWQLDSDCPLLQRAANQLHRYFEDPDFAGFDLPLAARGTPFQHSVWTALQRIPVGHTCTYGTLAKNLGRAKAVRAVGAAVGRNPWSLVVPCHRVVGANDALTGYAGGVKRKAWLLAWESGQRRWDYSLAE